MKTEVGSFTKGTTGSTTISLNDASIVVKKVTLIVGAKASGSDTENHVSTGFYDGANNISLSQFTDSTGSISKASNSKSISHWSRVSGTITEIIAGTVTAIGTGQFTVNLTAASSSYSIRFVVDGD